MWLLYALLSASSKGVGNALNKVGADKVDSVSLTWIARVIGLVFWIGAYLLLDNSESSFTVQFAIALAVAGSLTAIASTLRFDAFREGEVSHLIPLGNLLPVLSAIFAWGLLGEAPGLLGWIGILVVVFGAYMLNLQSSHIKWYEPFYDLYKAPASQKMLIVVGMLSVSVVFDKVALEDVSVYVWGISILLAQIVVLTPAVIRKWSSVKKSAVEHYKIITAVAFFSFLAFVLQLLSFEAGGLVGLTLAIKRLDSLVTISIAGLFMGESNILSRLKAGAIMAVGAVLVSLS